MCMRLNPTICGPRDHVHTVFSHMMRAANNAAIGKAKNHHTLSESGNALGVCTANILRGFSAVEKKQLSQTGDVASLRLCFAFWKVNECQPARRCAAQSQRVDGARPPLSCKRAAYARPHYIRQMIGEAGCSENTYRLIVSGGVDSELSLISTEKPRRLRHRK